VNSIMTGPVGSGRHSGGSGVEDDVPEFLRAVAEQVRATSAQFVPADRRVAATWRDDPESDPDGDPAAGPAAELVDGLARDWLVRRDVGEVVAVERVDGWWVALGAVGAPALPLDGALALTRPPGSPFADGDCDQIGFAGRLLSSLTGSAPLGSDREWRTSGHSAGLGLHTLYQGLDARGRTATAFAVRLDAMAAVADVLGARVAAEFVTVARRRIEAWAGNGRVLQLAGADFLVVRDDHPDVTAAALDAERLRHHLLQPVDVGDARISRTPSIGVAAAAPRPTSSAVLLAAAFAAMREAQRAGGNAVHVHGQERSCRLERLRLEVELQRAVHEGALRLYYQPEFDLRTGRLLGVEALLRWQHPARGLLLPEEFIDVAESSQSMTEIGEWVVRESFRQLAQWQAEFPAIPLLLRVNVAAAQFGDDKLVDLIVGELGRYGLGGEQVCIEITERSMPVNLTDLTGALARLRKAGLSSAIDDFGTGQSSFVHLRELPVDVIKVDRTFVSELPTDTRSRGIVSAMVELADAMDLHVVAEGVESHEAAAELIRLGCSRGQGNLLGAAMRPEQIRGLLQAGTGPDW
jgi:EAL domain-containing protein (putative c-di-GMP-specific phosphodiesterase class I)/GGDEF domain-containing protein